MAKAKRTLRRRLYEHLEPEARRAPGLSRLNRLIVVLICAASLLAILESEPTLYEGHERLFLIGEIIFTALFTVEYVARLWVAGEHEAYRGIVGRLRYATTLPALIDLMAILPVVLVFFGTEAFILRFVRLVRILRVARLGRFSRAMKAIGTAVSSRRYELWMSLAIALLLLMISSTLLYIVEGPVQPVTFGSIPRAMWWSVATLTTVGYGDVYPVTVLGRIFAGLTAITGIGLIAMPTGILAAAFSDAIQQQHRHQDRRLRHREEVNADNDDHQIER